MHVHDEGSRGALGCAGFRALNRRQALQAGAITALGGLSLADWYQAQGAGYAGNLNPAPAGAGKVRAKACIMMFMWGGPSQLDTWDPKPEAPSGIRGPFQAIATQTPGVFISEHFPRLAKQTERLAIVRSMSHDDPAHLSPAHRILTGQLAPVQKSDRDGPSPRDWPSLGSMLMKLRPNATAIPTSVTLPWIVAHPAAPGGRAPGQNGGWMGRSYDPLVIQGDPNDPNFRVAGLDLPDGVSLERVQQRRRLRDDLRALDQVGPASYSAHQIRALDALVSAEARGAFRIQEEDAKTRDRYGRNIHGQSLLLARRLVQSGVGLVTVNWHNDGQNFWDTHGDNFNQLKNRLMPTADQGFSALLDDLAARGMLDDTLLVWIGEFGRTPRIVNGSGREHWPQCYSAVLAGGGIQGGVVHGASDRTASYPARDPVRPEDIVATILDRLGVDPAGSIRDPLDRELRITYGSPLRMLYS